MGWQRLNLWARTPLCVVFWFSQVKSVFCSMSMEGKWKFFLVSGRRNRHVATRVECILRLSFVSWDARESVSSCTLFYLLQKYVIEFLEILLVALDFQYRWTGEVWVMMMIRRFWCHCYGSLFVDFKFVTHSEKGLIFFKLMCGFWWVQVSLQVLMANDLKLWW